MFELDHTTANNGGFDHSHVLLKLGVTAELTVMRSVHAAGYSPALTASYLAFSVASATEVITLSRSNGSARGGLGRSPIARLPRTQSAHLRLSHWRD